MSPGRELDALVAERVMGWQWRTWDRAAYRELCPVAWSDAYMSESRAVMVKPETVDTRLMPLAKGHETREMKVNPPPFSTDIAAAWQVVEKVGLTLIQSEDGWYAVKPVDIVHAHVRGTDIPTFIVECEEGLRPQPAETAPLAICRAALASLPSEQVTNDG